MIQIYNEDCLKQMKAIKDNSIDMILCDLPYGTTSCKWDVVIPFENLWLEYERIIKPNKAIVLFGSEPFSSRLRISNIKNYGYDWIWKKSRPSNFVHAKHQPLRYYENIMIFYYGKCLYYPIRYIGKKNHSNKGFSKSNHINYSKENIENTSNLKYPKNIIEIKSLAPQKILHPTQKPVLLLEYLIKTYSLKDDLILDNCMGSGSTGIACINTNRRFMGIEKDENYFNIALNRLREHQKQLRLF